MLKTPTVTTSAGHSAPPQTRENCNRPPSDGVCLVLYLFASVPFHRLRKLPFKTVSWELEFCEVCNTTLDKKMRSSSATKRLNPKAESSLPQRHSKMSMRRKSGTRRRLLHHYSSPLIMKQARGFASHEIHYFFFFFLKNIPFNYSVWRVNG